MTEQAARFGYLYETAPERVKSIVRRMMAIFKYGTEAAKGILLESQNNMPKTIEGIEDLMSQAEAVWRTELQIEKLPTVLDD